MSDVSLPTVPVVAPVAGDSVVGERGGTFQRFPVNLLLMQPHVGPTAPVGPTSGKEWFNNSTGKKYTWVEDGDSGQWVEGGGQYFADDPVSVAAAVQAKLDAQTAKADSLGARDATVAARDAAIAARVAAEAARDGQNTTGKVYTAAEGTAAGLAGTTNTQTFAVLDATLAFYVVYRNNAGAALELSRSYTKAYFDGMVKQTPVRGWAYVMTGLAGKLGFGVTAAGKFILGVGGDIVARITSNEVSIATQQARFVPTVRGGVYVWMLLDAARTKIALAVDRAGNLIAKGRDVLAEIDTAKALANAIGAMFKGDGNPRGAPFAVVDSTGRSPLMASRRGRILIWGRDVLTELDTLNSASLGLSVPTTARENGPYIAVSFTDGAGKKQIKTIRKSDGNNVVLTSAGNNVGATLTSDNKVLFVSDASGSWVQSYAPADGGTTYPTFSTADLAAWGDSLTAGAGSSGGGAGQGAYIKQLADSLGRTYYNGGIGGQTTPSIAARQGGQPALLTVTGNQIPASGAVAVTARTTNPITSQGAQSFSGTLAGVTGTLARAGDDSYTFTRAADGGAVACPAGSPFILDVAMQQRGSTALIVTGRNDAMTADATALLASIAAMLAYLTPYYKNFLVGLILNSTAEGIGSGNYNAIKARNDAIKAAYPNNYFDTQSPPTAGEMAALGFVPDATDNADIANGCIPTHMRNYTAADTLHLNNTGYALWAMRAKTAIQAKGW